MLKPKFTLVGAGPGDPELFTLKGVKALASADVVLYDALLDKELLNFAPQAKKIFVGKRSGFKVYSQEEIHELIVKYAFSNGHVVRLKGGDPFVFGRGSEEIDYVSNFGIEVELVPGITSSTAVPASLGIAVTQRHIAESFWVITGTTTERKLSEDLIVAAQTTATVVVLMGFGKLNQITKIYQEMDRGDTAVAVIQNGTRKDECKAVGTFDNILEEVKLNQVSTPAIIVIGDVVKASNKLRDVYEKVQIQNKLKIA
ncbi:MAG: uroporphyrinogen-III C-methyltransferase [Bacteroidota bacterium]